MFEQIEVKGEPPRNEIKKEAERVYNILYSLYTKKTEVNKPLLELIYDNTDSKYKPYESLVAFYLVKLIPLHLNVCPNDKYVFVNDKELNKILEEKK